MIFGQDKTSWQKFFYDIASRGIWVLPVFYYLQHYNIDLPINARQLFQKPTKSLAPRISLTSFFAYGVLLMFITHGTLRINPSFHFTRDIPFYIVVAFVEEIVFRGWALNALMGVLKNRRTAILLSTVFFILLHWPAYIIKYFTTGAFLATDFILQSLIVLITGILFSISFIKNKSLWAPLFLHAFFDVWIDLVVA